MSNRKVAHILVAALVLFGAAGCAAATPPPPTVAFVDIARYSGTWHELARLPMWFQRNCRQSQAEYSVQPGNGLRVVNSCPTHDGGRQEAHGLATVVDAASNAKLTVRFDNWFSRLFPRLTTGDYWIFYLDPAYQTAIVGTPDRKFLWILARTPAVAPETFRRLVEQARALGFATERLLRFNPE
ncbi:MAG TPA: lipocalin family protein [Desulfurivibrionaceae bacterium]|nr:lipocalin family protein [Desulfurivibrionaceae bacterium]